MHGHVSEVWALAFAPDGKKLVVGDFGLSLRVLSVPELKESAAWPTSPDRGYTAVRVAFAPDGKTVAAGLRDGKILIYDSESGKVLQKLDHRN